MPQRALGSTHRAHISHSHSATFATVSPSIIPKSQPPLPPTTAESYAPPSKTPFLDQQVLKALQNRSKESDRNHTTLIDIISHYLDETGNILHVSLPYESRPSEDRRVQFSENGGSKEVITVAHCAVDRQKGEHKITLSSGFALNANLGPDENPETLIVTCAHTLEEIRQSPLMLLTEFPPSDPSHHVDTGTFICIGEGEAMKAYPASGIVAALPRSDVVIISCPLPKGTLKSLPLSPYPAPEGTSIRAHFVSQEKPYNSDWNHWIGDTWGHWVRGTVAGYRDFAGRETKPGTYDSLSHMLFTPFPTAGSSGGPIVDEESGAVVGIMLGSRMDNRVAGVRGWGIPSETIFEMFALPGLEGKM